jgi:AcrR family transcriptional regulator
VRYHGGMTVTTEALREDALREEGLRERKKRRTRAALRRAALSLTVERGLDHVTVDEIAAAAEVSPRTFFNYFASKEEAVVGDDPDARRLLLEHLRERPADEPPLVALGAALATYADEMAADHDLWTLRRALLEQHPELLPRLLGASASAEREVAAALAERAGLPAGHPYPALVASVALAAARTAVHRSVDASRAVSPSAAIVEAFAALADGLPAPA